MRVVGPYVVQEEIARGGMGVVLRATSPQGHTVAVKVLARSNDVARRRFEREARVLTRLQHPNLVEVLDAGIHEGSPYLVMEMVAGETLQDRLNRGGWLPVDEAAEICRKLAHALQQVHEAGILHRDVKPSNILLRDKRPLLTDFGLAREGVDRSSLTKTGSFLGTPGYWPPEQARGEHDRVGPAADIYALGATLYAALTGAPPFDGDSLAESLRKTLEEPPPPPTRKRPEIGATLERVCLTCLAKDPGDRYRSADLLAQALADAQATAPRRVHLGAILAAVCAALVVATAGVSVALLGDSASPAAVAPPPETDPPPPAPVAAEDADDPEPHVIAPNAEELRLKAKALLQRGDGRGAIAALKQAAQLDPESAVLESDLALALFFIGDAHGGLPHVNRAIELDDRNGKAYAVRALIEFQLGDHDAAIADATAAIERDPKIANAYITRGNAYHARVAFTRAIEDFTSALDLLPDDAQALHNRGMAFVGLGQLDRGIADFDRILARDPRYVPGLISRGIARLRQRKLVEAMTDFDAALPLVEEGSETHRQLVTLRAEAARDLARER